MNYGLSSPNMCVIYKFQAKTTNRSQKQTKKNKTKGVNEPAREELT